MSNAVKQESIARRDGFSSGSDSIITQLSPPTWRLQKLFFFKYENQKKKKTDSTATAQKTATLRSNTRRMSRVELSGYEGKINCLDRLKSEKTRMNCMYWEWKNMKTKYKKKYKKNTKINFIEITFAITTAAHNGEQLIILYFYATSWWVQPLKYFTSIDKRTRFHIENIFGE